MILDWDIAQIEGAFLEEWLPKVFGRRMASCIFASVVSLRNGASDHLTEHLHLRLQDDQARTASALEKSLNFASVLYQVCR
jgi:hypothetical protein